MAVIRGIARLDRKTKNLVKRLQPGEIAVINHQELDEVCAQALVDARVKAVVNAAKSLSEDYPNLGPQTLVNAGIYLLDNVGPEIMEKIIEETVVEIDNNEITVPGQWTGRGMVLTAAEVREHTESAKKNIGMVLEKFVQNTIEYARQEQGLLLGDIDVPATKTVFQNRHTLIVVRGQNYKDDLIAIRSYIEEVKPVLVGVDGGADALMEFGYKPDVIIGDMDSISDKTLQCGAELVVHAYSDGRAPGMNRIMALGLEAVTLPAPGTSEDIAMLLAYHKSTELIVALGTHTNLIDFLDKGRKGMSSTFLVRLKVGSILIDAKGVNKLYRNKVKFRYLAELVAAASVTVAIVGYTFFPVTRQLVRVFWLKLKFALGI
ncbi:MAG: putative cytokinetic ring protein SteA [Thermincola sp.]|nr:putative cytokinetic ring protein SteA [Thermincola sp.]MDT3703672.1 putative cytokinetic ring protein SteA [Thermincola sp.]